MSLSREILEVNILSSKTQLNTSRNVSEGSCKIRECHQLAHEPDLFLNSIQRDFFGSHIYEILDYFRGKNHDVSNLVNHSDDK